MSAGVASPTTSARAKAVGVRAGLPVLTVFAVSGVYALLAAYFSLRRHDGFRSGFDLAAFDQELWLLANGHAPLNTQHGLLWWGEHFSVSVTLLTPFYALGAGPAFLLTLQALTVALVAPLLYALARSYGARPWLAALPGLLWLASPLTVIPNVNDFHHVPLVAPVIVGSVLALKHDRLILFAILAAVACGAKEDVALLYVMLGLVVAWEGRRRLGALIAASSLGLFLVVILVYMPAVGSMQGWYEQRFAGDRGDSVLDVGIWMLEHPGGAIGHFLDTPKLGLLLALLVTTGGLCLLAPRWMLLGVPALGHNLVSAYGPQHGIWDQYQYPVMVSLAIAAAVGVHRLPELGPRVKLLAAAGVTLGFLVAPLGFRHVDRVSEWNEARVAALGGPEARRAALALVPDDVPVAASVRVTPHLSQRREIYTLPNPFFGHDVFGTGWTGAELAEREQGVGWVVLDVNDHPLEWDDSAQRLPAVLRARGFAKVFDEGTVSVWRR